MTMGDGRPPPGMYWTDAAGWVPMTCGDWNLDQAMRARFTAEEIAREPTPTELRCDGHDAYDGRDPPTCEPMCIACIKRWQPAALGEP